MFLNKNSIPVISDEELPSKNAARLARVFASSTSALHKKQMGQFFTPDSIAAFMAGMSTIKKIRIRILDPGSGVGILSCAIAEHLAMSTNVKMIELDTYDIDRDLTLYIESAISYLRVWLQKQNILLVHRHFCEDFVVKYHRTLSGGETGYYDIIISNPPYFKIAATDQRKYLLKEISSGQMNIYAAFAGIAIRLLKKGGLIIFIIPRSFCSGAYFRSFRNLFFSNIQLERIHLFASRKAAFSADSVLQENVIMKGCKVLLVNRTKKIQVSQSEGISEITNAELRSFAYQQLVNVSHKDTILFLPDSAEQESVMELVAAQQYDLEKLGYKVSTGPVVYFRKTAFLTKEKQSDTVPLIWLNNVQRLLIEHPMNGNSREQYIVSSIDSDSVLIDNTNMVLVRRMTSKEEDRRLIAAPHVARQLTEKLKIGIENKVNYIVRKKGALSIHETLGIASMLNSRIYDDYFRTFNGNTHVSATELKRIPFPSRQSIEEVGKRVAGLKKPNDKKIENIVASALTANTK
jgi:adenine-specific DNA-methyltransferase